MSRRAANGQVARFVSFEGGEGSGKTTQISLLADWLRKKGQQVLMTREPGGSAGAEEIRNLLLTGDPDRWDGLSELLLLYAGRHDHISRVINPALAAGQWVLCDRFADSTMAYQGYGHNLGCDLIADIHRIVLGNFTPDLTILFDLSVDKGLSRAVARHGNEMRYEEMDIAFHQRLRQGYLAIAQKNTHRFKIIDADQSVDKIAHDIRKIVRARGGLA